MASQSVQTQTMEYLQGTCSLILGLGVLWAAGRLDDQVFEQMLRTAAANLVALQAMLGAERAIGAAGADLAAEAEAVLKKEQGHG